MTALRKWACAAAESFAFWQIESNYKRMLRCPSDIYQHLPLLRKLSRSCSTVCEMGVRKCVSSWAFLMGLAENSSFGKELLCVDLVPADIKSLHRWGSKIANPVHVTMEIEDSRKIKLPHDYDLLFIDTLHVYGQLKTELWTHHPHVRRFICLHDTETDKIEGEVKRMGWDVRQVSRDTGMTEDEVSRGLGPALNEFLEAFPHWKIMRNDSYNNGLTVLIRESP